MVVNLITPVARFKTTGGTALMLRPGPQLDLHRTEILQLGAKEHTLSVVLEGPHQWGGGGGGGWGQRNIHCQWF